MKTPSARRAFVQGLFLFALLGVVFWLSHAIPTFLLHLIGVTP